MKFFFKLLNNKRGDIEEFVKMALWVLAFVGLSFGVYFLAKNLGGMI